MLSYLVLFLTVHIFQNAVTLLFLIHVALLICARYHFRSVHKANSAFRPSGVSK